MNAEDDAWGDLDELTAPEPCAACGRDPAIGFASLFDPAIGELWFCHPDDPALPDCYSGERQ